MSNKDQIDQLFEEFKGQFDLHDTPQGHQARFMSKLNAKQDKPVENKRNWWRPLSIAASFLVLITLGISVSEPEQDSADLASVSPEMEQAESFFVTTINQELATLKEFENEETKVIIDDALTRLDRLEKDYDQLKVALKESGNDKRVINAMIANFQDRIELLQEVIQTIEQIEHLKANKDETII